MAIPIFASVWVGNGGDALRLVILNAQRQAGVMATQVRPEFLGDKLSDREKDWIQSNQLLLASEILRARLDWREDPDAPTCARTNVPPDLKAIYFYFFPCRQFIKVESDATFLMLHEGVHLLGVTDENFADHVAMGILEGWQRMMADSQAWRPVRLQGAPSSRAYLSGAWISSPANVLQDTFLIWGGCRQERSSSLTCSQYFNDGFVYNSSKDVWTPLPQAPLMPRARHTGVWAAHESSPQKSRFIVWGGCGPSSTGACQQAFNDGAHYDPLLQTWKELSSQNAPSARVFHSATWTGKGLVIWGGTERYLQQDSKPSNSGWIYKIEEDSWTSLSKAPLSPRREHSAIWTADTGQAATSGKLIVWGGCDEEVVGYCTNYLGDGAIWDAATDTWKTMSSINAPSSRRRHSAVWTGRQMIVWGGDFDRETLNTGAIYDVATDTWTEMSAISIAPRTGHVAFWTGKQMLVYGGSNLKGEVYGDLATYTPGFPDVWSPVPVGLSPLPRSDAFAAWTGVNLMVWGGLGSRGTFLNTGGWMSPR